MHTGKNFLHGQEFLATRIAPSLCPSQSQHRLSTLWRHIASLELRPCFPKYRIRTDSLNIVTLKQFPITVNGLATWIKCLCSRISQCWRSRSHTLLARLCVHDIALFSLVLHDSRVIIIIPWTWLRIGDWMCAQAEKKRRARHLLAVWCMNYGRNWWFWQLMW